MLVFLLLINLVAVIDTEITLKTLPEHKVMISAVKPGQTYSLIKSFHPTSNINGEAKITLSTSEDTFNLKVWVKTDGKTIASENFENEYPSGEPVTIEVYTDEYNNKIEAEKIKQEEEVAKIAEEEAKTAAEIALQQNQTNEKENTSLLSGFAITSLGILKNKIIYYILGGIIILILIIILRKKIFKKFKSSSSELMNYENKDLNKAKEDLEKAQRELKQIENKEKIEVAKRKIIEDEKELLRLRRGE